MNRRSLAAVRPLAAVLTVSGLLAAGACSSSDDASPSASGSASATATTSSGASATTSGGSASASGSSAPGGGGSTSAPFTPGDIDETVPPVSVETKAPVSIGKPVDFGGGVTGRITGVAATTAQAKLPGEVAGPAIRFTVTIANKSQQSVDLTNVVVNVYGSDKAPGGQITSGSEKGVSGILKPGASTSGAYLFTVAKDKRTPVTIEVIYQAEKPVAQFVGNVP